MSLLLGAGSAAEEIIRSSADHQKLPRDGPARMVALTPPETGTVSIEVCDFSPSFCSLIYAIRFPSGDHCTRRHRPPGAACNSFLASSPSAPMIPISACHLPPTYAI